MELVDPGPACRARRGARLAELLEARSRASSRSERRAVKRAMRRVRVDHWLLTRSHVARW